MPLFFMKITWYVVNNLIQRSFKNSLVEFIKFIYFTLFYVKTGMYCWSELPGHPHLLSWFTLWCDCREPHHFQKEMFFGNHLTSFDSWGGQPSEWKQNHSKVTSNHKKVSAAVTAGHSQPFFLLLHTSSKLGVGPKNTKRTRYWSY